MEAAVHVYDSLRLRHIQQGVGADDDYVFYPEFRNRTYAKDCFRRLFSNALIELGLKSDEYGKSRTAYSLRHTALMFRALYGDRIDPLLLARNSMTSIAMLEEHYLSHLQPESRIDELHSWRDGIALYCHAPEFAPRAAPKNLQISAEFRALMEEWWITKNEAHISSSK
jgi:integrase